MDFPRRGECKSNDASPNLIYDINTSFKSPFNIDRLVINDATPEGEKFNSIYDEGLAKSPEFQKLFIDLFGGDQKRFNVKFEIAEHVYKDNKEVNATTSQDPVTKNIIIKISKQILTADGTKSQTKIENAKTILHECIHAYLFVKAKNPAVGVDIVKTLNTMYPTANEQHDFMYNKMIPTMQKVLGEIRDLVTEKVNRDYFENFTLHPTTTPLTSVTWNWKDYFYYLSLNGLEEANCFKTDFPEKSYEYKLFTTYISNGHKYLNK